MTNSFIKTLRLKNKYTQEYVASVLNISRQSYAILENDNAKIKIEQIEKLSNLYNISKSDLINQKEKNININIISNPPEEENHDIRINIPQSNINKFNNSC